MPAEEDCACDSQCLKNVIDIHELGSYMKFRETRSLLYDFLSDASGISLACTLLSSRSR
jgi:hypothetical protein